MKPDWLIKPLGAVLLVGGILALIKQHGSKWVPGWGVVQVYEPWQMIVAGIVATAVGAGLLFYNPKR